MKFKTLICMLTALILMIMQVSAVYVVQESNLQINDISSVSGAPGDALELVFEVENTGNQTIDEIQVISSDLIHGSDTIAAPDIEALINLSGESLLQAAFTFTVPSVPAGVYEGELTVVDTGNNDNTDTLAYSVTVNEVDDFEVSVTNLKITVQADDEQSTGFTITNTGSSTLIFDLDAEGDFVDDDFDPINIFFSSPDPLEPGDNVDIIVTADVDNAVDEELYIGKILVSSGIIEKEIGLAVDVQPQICEEGIVGDLEIELQDPDNNEDFNPGDIMDIDVRVDNHYSKDMDVIVKAILYNTDEDEEVASVTSQEEEIDDGDYEGFDLELEIPTGDIDEDDEYVLFVKAYEEGDEDENCHFDSVNIEIERGDDNIIVKEIEVDQETYSCGDKVYVDVEVENIGTDDQEDVYILLKSKELDVDLKSEKFELDDYDDVDSRYDVRFEFNVPDVDAGEYFLEAYVNYGNNDLNSDFIKINVDGAQCSPVIPDEPRIKLSPVQDTIEVEEGQEKFVIPLKIANTGGSPASFRLDVTEASGWAKVIGTEVPETLHGQESYHAYVYMELLGNVAEGTHNLRVNLRDGEALLQSKMLDIVVSEGTMETGNQQDVTWLSDVFTDKSKLFWFVGDAILVIVALVFIRMLLRR